MSRDSADMGPRDAVGRDCPQSIRLDKWLWYARFAKSRSIAQTLIETGAVRVNRKPVDRPHQPLRIGDVLSLVLPRRHALVQVTALGNRRGPADEARTLYAEVSARPNAARCQD